MENIVSRVDGQPESEGRVIDFKRLKQKLVLVIPQGQVNVRTIVIIYIFIISDYPGGS